MSKEKIYIFDTTLRDGAQTEGVDFSVEDKNKIAKILSNIGLDYIEGGWPGANPIENEFFDNSPNLGNSKFTAFGMTKKNGVSADNDPNLSPLMNADCKTVCVVGKTWDFHVKTALGINNEDKIKLFETVMSAIKQMGYLGLGTLEFLYHEGNFYFMEMNTRLQVEHPITEMITRIDLVREQISVAGGEKLSFDQSKINPLGHSIECRINAEDPKTFKPSAGTINLYHPPAGNGIRLDTFIYSGYKVPHYYDNLLAKLIVTGRDRDHAIRRALRSLDEIIIEGTVTNIELHKKILSSEDFKKGSVSIKWLEENIESL